MAFVSMNSIAFADMVQIKGSDTLINLVQKMAEVYMEQNPGKMITVTGGGSGTGIASIINGKADIANASRQMKQKEIDLAVSKGISPKRIVVAIDGLSIVVHPDNPIEKMTFEDVGKIYRGEINNWKDLGGKDSPITLYGRQPNSGTYDFMMEVVMKGDYSPKMRQMNGNAQIIESIARDESAIGYVGVGYAKETTDVKALEIAKKAGGKYYSPFNTEDVENGSYPISRPLNQYVNGKPAGDVLDFIKFELSEQGQEIVEAEGFFRIPAEYQEFNSAAAGE